MRDVDAAGVEDRHAHDLAGALLAVADVLVDVPLGRLRGGRVGVELPRQLQADRRPVGRDALERLERVADAVRAAEEDEPAAVHVADADGDDQVQWKMFGPIRWSSRATIRPVRLSSTTRLGASGERILRWVLSTPLQELT